MSKDEKNGGRKKVQSEENHEEKSKNQCEAGKSPI